ncbi:MAG TPA: hypothetical protein VN081_03905 [Dongiaceae bacterium]|nr:hypothetical protein [Dongiaceae bacterium]
MYNNFLPDVKSIGAQNALPDSTVRKQTADTSSFVAGVTHMANQLAAKNEQDRKDQENLKRQADLAAVSTQDVVDATQGYSDYKANYTGDPAQFAQGAVASYQSQMTKTANSITDPKLRLMYQEHAAKQLATMKLNSIQDQQALELTDLNGKIKANTLAQHNLIILSPTLNSLQFAAGNVDAQYAQAAELLNRTGKQDAAIKDAEQIKTGLATDLILQQAKVDPDQALTTLKEKDVRDMLDPTGTNPDITTTLAAKVETIRNVRNKPLIEDAKAQTAAYIEGLSIGNDVSGIKQRIGELHSLGTGIFTPDMERQIVVAEALAPKYAAIRDRMSTLNQAQLNEIIDSLDPHNDPNSPAGVTLPERVDFHDKAAAALRKQFDVMSRNPIATTAALTGASDPETASLQYVHSRLSTGENVNNINVLDENTMAQPLLNKINNGVTGGNVDAVVNVFNEMRQAYKADAAHPNRQIMPNVDLYDMALNQLARTSKDPLTGRVIAAAKLLPSDQPIDSHNSLLIKAAMMTSAQRKNLLDSTGLSTKYTGNALDGLARDLMKTNKTWATFFNRPNLSPEASKTLMAQQSVLLDTVLLNMATGQYKRSGGFGVDLPFVGHLGAFETSAQDNATNAIIQNYLPYAPITVQGNPSTHRPAPVNVMGVSLYAPPDLSVSALGATLSARSKDWRVNINNSDLLIPQEMQNLVNGDAVRDFTGAKLTDKSWLFQNVRLPGFNDTGSGPASPTTWKKSPEFITKVNSMSTRLGADPNDLMAVMKIESGLNAGAMNKTSSATGLIQWMKYPGGMSRQQFAGMDELDQLNHVEKWFSPYAGKLNTPGKVYLAVAAPGVLSQLPANAPPSTVVYAAGSREAKANPAWQDKTGAVTLGRLDALVQGTKQKLGITPGPTDWHQLDAGKQQMLAKYINNATQNITLRTSDDMRGVRVYTQQGNRVVPFMGRDGAPLIFSYDDIAKFNRNLSSR